MILRSVLALSVAAICSLGCGDAGSDDSVESSEAGLAAGTYLFVSGVTSSRCLDVAGGGSADRTNIHQWTCNFSEAQKFRVEPVARGVRLVNIGSNKCVDVDGNRTQNFTNVQLYRCNGSGAQTFRVNHYPDGAVNFVHITSNRCVGVADGNPAQGTNVRIRDCGPGSASQKWFPRDGGRPVRIMPLGASITQGAGGTRAGYRGPLSAMLDQHRISHRFVGSQTSNPGPLPAFQAHHEGHPGWVISEGNGNDGIGKHINGWLGVDPDIVLILLGSNDVVRQIDLGRAGARMDGLLGQIRGQKPRALIYVATVPRIDDKPTLTANYNQAIANVVRAREARGEPVHLVDAYSVVRSPQDKADGIHPNNSGYDRIATAWRDAIVGR
jgi:lysophospholipase L1-like esterase